ncbi:uncharacterized protein LOC100899188 [Galendromus occidentalis]|uniref:Uncharacterized protein LOC100899188 n=1 Tax=Galendromus occidentalis TaxID=34638 RepID=A0AAJ7P9R3_9ACAR|nr:uncharacterized protein LOC100899188 [Galendromus occidentalis]
MTSDAVLESIDRKLSSLGSALEVETNCRAGRFVLVEHRGRLRRACIANQRRIDDRDSFDVYLLDYPECANVAQMFKCPPDVAAIHRALLFVKLIGRQRTDSVRYGIPYRLVVDKFLSHVILGLVLEIPRSQSVASR